MENLTNEQWQERLAKDENAVVLDVRTQEEVDEGVIPNAQHLDIYDSAGFMQGVQEMDKSKSYYVYCRSGGRSQQACMLMNQMGIENTYNLKTGFSEWDGETSKL
ncbi:MULTISPECIES: rhodanese-like domain-containing protein [Croceibacter]|jgi:rhodanese-related sulfurtransferase|uniref:Rhodanese-like domain protein n=1 Tax=Croceibacter atlanticus (strain ATCC BAA-628 / JCM 21780 / CIP 108009 / IAM 15332 / KCTC 12090 / HTCC2559) TaxID=216432 RepID=A3U809_CROAH|nr:MULTISPECIES: rhodanese-like domain-containing protein [Croceibacter]HAT70342.1 rhodanese-like domain-containing protein [Flavobacteriaceae bacterium]EAP88376.1 rhodanese-like domain protein [Croceibacter atlanticus HTCC2559]MBG26767.1 rhodanese-like domain-containing protein [Croceibacter sp.]MBW4969488.1 rhodanese-like domain-containing protein [Croceibacter atlanticus]WSP33361.1 rhodanese-like domain-containing protein [Croceibacter atlanticus]|tara:strand:- start:1047 stop:1361 length:315 start_codon:yes stop_codon:yes gene_type:complete